MVVPFTREHYHLLDRRDVCPNKFVVSIIRRVCEIFQSIFLFLRDTNANKG